MPERVSYIIYTTTNGRVAINMFLDGTEHHIICSSHVCPGPKKKTKMGLGIFCAFPERIGQYEYVNLPIIRGETDYYSAKRIVELAGNDYLDALLYDTGFPDDS